ncbi:MAG: hypothetical protein DLM68_05420 [Hyphomicrobiales bacterium]|nr:MAG: hypothetical protein DLM68_05420 [Hyphomicrobiales bacterium]
MRPDQAALVFDPDGSMSLILPDLPEDAPVPAAWKLLVAIVHHLDDPNWVAAMVGGTVKPSN